MPASAFLERPTVRGPYGFSVAENPFHVLGDGDPDHLRNRTITTAGDDGPAAGGTDHAVAITGISAGTATIGFALSPARPAPGPDLHRAAVVSLAWRG